MGHAAPNTDIADAPANGAIAAAFMDNAAPARTSAVWASASRGVVCNQRPILVLSPGWWEIPLMALVVVWKGTLVMCCGEIAVIGLEIVGICLRIVVRDGKFHSCRTFGRSGSPRLVFAIQADKWTLHSQPEFGTCSSDLASPTPIPNPVMRD